MMTSLARVCCAHSVDEVSGDSRCDPLASVDACIDPEPLLLVAVAVRDLR